MRYQITCTDQDGQNTITKKTNDREKAIKIAKAIPIDPRGRNPKTVRVIDIENLKSIWASDGREIAITV